MLFRIRLPRGQSLHAPISTLNIFKGVPRWKRALYITVPVLILFNYLIIFQWTFFEELRNRLWPDASFHPGAFPQTTHSHHDGEPDYWLWDTLSSFSPPKPGGRTDDCASFPTPLLDKIQVVLKTGVADNRDRTAAQLSTVIKCIPNILISSDLTHAYGPAHNATDMLASLPAKTYMTRSDYAIYTSQQHADAASLAPGHDGWKLDKYKFLPQVEQAVARNTAAEWFVFLESDTYVFWDNMFRLLSSYDPAHPYYFGSPSPGRTYRDAADAHETKTVWFAYGGAGFVLSGAAAHRLVDRLQNSMGVTGPRVTDEYKKMVRSDCCGDSVLGWAVHDRASVEISGLFPMFNPHSLHGIPFGNAARYWCEPVVSLHKTHPGDFGKIWQFERDWDREKGPLLYRDVLVGFWKLDRVERMEDWDNADWDGFNEESADHESNQSFEACRAYCLEHEKCWQFTWHGHHCWMSKALRMGQPKEPDGYHEEIDRKYVSGWDTEKIRKFVRGNTCEEGAHWVKPSIARIF
jgi:hypothetical protein